MKRGDQRRNFGCRRLRALRSCPRGRCRGCSRRSRERRGFLWTHGVSRLCRGGLRRASAEFLAGRLTRPRAGIDLPHQTQPFLGFRLAGEESHVQTETLATLLEAAAHEERKALELGQIRLRERHRRRRRAQIEDVRSCLCSRRRRMVRVHLSGRQICRWCHKFPGQSNSHGLSESARDAEGNAFDRADARSWQPRRHRNRPLDRWLCVPAFRRVCPCH